MWVGVGMGAGRGCGDDDDDDDDGAVRGGPCSFVRSFVRSGWRLEVEAWCV